MCVCVGGGGYESRLECVNLLKFSSQASLSIPCVESETPTRDNKVRDAQCVDLPCAGKCDLCR